MDAIKFVNEMVRMCAEYPKCDGCPVAVQNDDEDCMAKVPAEQMVAIVEEWAKKNPVKTRQSVFLEQWPEANIDNLNVLEVCPASISTSYRNEYGGCANIGVNCWDCRHEFWMQEVE